MSSVKWPSNIVDGDKLYELFGYGTDDPDVIGEEAHDRVVDLEVAIDQALADGQLTRISAKDPATGEVVGHGYKLAELRRKLGALLPAEEPAKSAPVPAVPPAPAPVGAAAAARPAIGQPATATQVVSVPKKTEPVATCPSCKSGLPWPGANPSQCPCGTLRARREQGKPGEVDIVIYIQGKARWRFRES